MEDKTYNGWTNRATWNVALWLQNDWDGEIEEWVRDRKFVKNGQTLKDRVEDQIRELELRAYYLEPPRGMEIVQFFTPDGERFDEANWQEIFDHLILEPRVEDDERKGGVA